LQKPRLPRSRSAKEAEEALKIAGSEQRRPRKPSRLCKIRGLRSRSEQRRPWKHSILYKLRLSGSRSELRRLRRHSKEFRFHWKIDDNMRQEV
jgi:hypothetical protein